MEEKSVTLGALLVGVVTIYMFVILINAISTTTQKISRVRIRKVVDRG